MVDTKEINYSNVGDFLVEEIPEFKKYLIEHKQDNEEVLPHVLFGDFARFFVTTYLDSKNNDSLNRVVRRSVAFIEKLFVSDSEQLQELAQASFIENIQELGVEIFELRELLGTEGKRRFDLMYSR